MAVEIEGATYCIAAIICRKLGVSHQMLWRWRNEGKIPAGPRFRDRQFLCTQDEIHSIREHANRLESLDGSEASEQFRSCGTMRKRRTMTTTATTGGE